jgi:hypothetical protein
VRQLYFFIFSSMIRKRLPTIESVVDKVVVRRPSILTYSYKETTVST